MIGMNGGGLLACQTSPWSSVQQLFHTSNFNLTLIAVTFTSSQWQFSSKKNWIHFFEIVECDHRPQVKYVQERKAPKLIQLSRLIHFQKLPDRV